jgi:hypothetical protein
MDQSQIDRIENQISQFYEVVQSALSQRLRMWGEYSSARMRAEGLADQMVEVANVATDLEEKLSMMLIIQQHIDMLWDDAVATYLDKSPFASSDRYKSFRETEYAVVAENGELHSLKKRLDACVETGKRGVARLESLHAVASRAAGIAYSQ